MSYSGNEITAVPFQIDVYSGNASQVTFGPLVRAPTVASIAVFISGVYKTPGIDYTVDSDYITFTSAPASGTNNIVIHHIGNGFMATQVPGDGTVTTGKIVAGSITGNLIGTNAISGNNISQKSINASNSVVELSITGNLIGTGAISANNFAGGGITSNVLSSNLSISTVRVAETVNVMTTAIGGNYNIHVANSTVYYFMANTTANVTFNFVANDGTATGTTGALNDLIRVGQTASIAIALKQGSTRYRANVFIDGVRANGIYWLGNSQPLFQTTQQQSVDAYNFTIIKIADSPANYTVLASNSTFSHANGQGMGATNGTVY